MNERKLTPQGHIHVEAFCLMHYRCSACHHLELIWNSRDGVTPVSMRCPSCGNVGHSMGNMSHAAFDQDVYAPEHKLNRYQKFWRDMTFDEATKIINERYERSQGTKYVMPKSMLDEMLQKLKDDWDNPERTEPFHKGKPMLDVYLG